MLLTQTVFFFYHESDHWTTGETGFEFGDLGLKNYSNFPNSQTGNSPLILKTL